MAVVTMGITLWFKYTSRDYYIDVIMTTMASQITSLTVVYLTVYSAADQRKHQSAVSLAFVWGIHRDRWIPCTKGQLHGKCFHLMTSSCTKCIILLYLFHELVPSKHYSVSFIAIPWQPVDGEIIVFGCSSNQPANNRGGMSWLGSHHGSGGNADRFGPLMINGCNQIYDKN